MKFCVRSLIIFYSKARWILSFRFVLYVIYYSSRWCKLMFIYLYLGSYHFNQYEFYARFLNLLCVEVCNLNRCYPYIACIQCMCRRMDALAYYLSLPSKFSLCKFYTTCILKHFEGYRHVHKVTLVTIITLIIIITIEQKETNVFLFYCKLCQ